METPNKTQIAAERKAARLQAFKAKQALETKLEKTFLAATVTVFSEIEAAKKQAAELVKCGDVLSAIRLRRAMDEKRAKHVEKAKVLTIQAKAERTIASAFLMAKRTRTPAEVIAYQNRMDKKAAREIAAQIALLPLDANQYAVPVEITMPAPAQIAVNQKSANNTKNGKKNAKAAVLPALATKKPGRQSVADIKNSISVNPNTFGTQAVFAI